ncbi:hypothetical protein SAMN04487949_1891 [Halogranum gelatinilyticum]|uniref:Endonuclease n=1 Tax=Halogranum gelatinilyticum TaxID=660521 RepID=A0A1G9TS94_9EURY|nr:hypothetical protein SAMN04487949_1891 [Halogranum gelatinilyticum]
MYWSEKYQLGIVADYLREEGYQFATEARLYSIPIDIVALQGNTTVAVELKSRDFKRGINQAERNTSVVDFSYLSVWEENITDDLVSRIDDSPIGLLSVGTHVKCLSPPVRNDPSTHAKSRVQEYVRNHVRK